MKTALITTTINVPKVLALYRKFGPDVEFFIALDEKTDTAGIANDPILHGGLNNHWLPPDLQRSRNYKSSELIGWNTDSRRNIALLEALKWGAEIIVSVDDDMIPITPDFFSTIERVMTQPWSGLAGNTKHKDHWFDAGMVTFPQATQRGLPLNNSAAGFGDFVVGAEIGVMQCAIVGIPDTNGPTTAVSRPYVTGLTDILRAGFVVDLDAKAVFNSQLTVFRRELAPCFAQFYKWQKRNTDIIASVIMRRIMRPRQLYTYYGPPIGFHARTPRPVLKDLQAEMWGLENIEAFADYLDNTSAIPDLTQGSCVPQLRAMYQDLLTFGLLPKECSEAGLAWCDDVESVL